MQTVSYKCPNCGAPLTFSIDSQSWECHFCNSTFTPEQIEQLDSNTESQVEENSWETAEYQSENTKVYTCPDCGGRVITDDKTVSTFCAYCHSPNVIAGKLQGEYRPHRIIPFQINKDTALEKFKNLLKRKILLPKKFRSILEKGELTGVYMPYWLYDASVSLDLSAIGHRVTSWSDTRNIYTKTDTYKIQRHGQFPFFKIPADGSTQLDDTLADSLEPYDINKMVPFDMPYLSGFFAESFDVDPDICFKRVYARAKNTSQSMLRSTMTSYNSVTQEMCNFYDRRTNTEYVMFPIWLLSTTWKGNIYHYALNGQTGKAAGKVPVSKGRLAVLFGLSVLLLTLILLFFTIFIF